MFGRMARNDAIQQATDAPSLFDPATIVTGELLKTRTTISGNNPGI